MEATRGGGWGRPCRRGVRAGSAGRTCCVPQPCPALQAIPLRAQAPGRSLGEPSGPREGCAEALGWEWLGSPCSRGSPEGQCSERSDYGGGQPQGRAGLGRSKWPPLRATQVGPHSSPPQVPRGPPHSGSLHTASRDSARSPPQVPGVHDGLHTHSGSDHSGGTQGLRVSSELAAPPPAVGSWWWSPLGPLDLPGG